MIAASVMKELKKASNNEGIGKNYHYFKVYY